MRQGAAFAVFALLFLVAFASDEDEIETDEVNSDQDEDYVHELNEENFNRRLENYERVLVEFYMPKCKPCLELAPTYSKASKYLKVEEMSTILAKVDGSQNRELVAKYKVTDYPTLIYFVNGTKNKDYNGRLDADGISLWLKNKEFPPIKILGEDEVQAWIDETEADGFAMVARLKKGHSRKKVYYAAVEESLSEWENARFKFAAVWLPKDADPKQDSKISIWRPKFRHPDPKMIDFGGVWKNDAVVHFAQNATYESLGSKFTRMKYAPMTMEELGWEASVVAVIDDNTISEGDDEIEGKAEKDKIKPRVREALLPFIYKHPEWRFTFADIEKVEDHELDLLATSLGKEPRLVWLGKQPGQQKGRNYQLVGADKIMDPQQIESFFQDVKAGKIKPSYRSAAEPEEEIDPEDGVRILTGNTWEEVAMDPEKDVFVEYYSPTCQHCQKLAKDWTKLAKKAEKGGWSGRNIVIAKMDAISNECEEPVDGFPKMVLYPAVKAGKKMKARQEYQGLRTAQALYDFVAENARNLQQGEEEEEEEPRKKKRRRRKVESMVDREMRKKKKAAEEL